VNRPRLEQRPPQPTLELEPASEPALDGEAAANSPRLVVQAAAVPVDQPARRVGDQLAERRNAVLQRHPGATVASARPIQLARDLRVEQRSLPLPCSVINANRFRSSGYESSDEALTRFMDTG
jgi:hypothetical protein